MSARIIISPDLETRKQRILELLLEKELAENHPDTYILEDDEKLGVEAAKKIREFLSLKPYSAKGRGVAILSAQNLTHDAQNALLKTLEEPPESATILLGADSDIQLLPTILSRCEIERTYHGSRITDHKVDSIASLQNDIAMLIQANMSERFAYIEKLEEKDQFLDALITYFRNQLSKDQTHLKFAKELIEAEKYKNANGNMRGILEHLMLVL